MGEKGMGHGLCRGADVEEKRGVVGDQLAVRFAIRCLASRSGRGGRHSRYCARQRAERRRHVPVPKALPHKSRADRGGLFAL